MCILYIWKVPLYRNFPFFWLDVDALGHVSSETFVNESVSWHQCHVSSETFVNESVNWHQCHVSSQTFVNESVNWHQCHVQCRNFCY